MKNKILVACAVLLGLVLMSAAVINVGSGVSSSRYTHGSGPFYTALDTMAAAALDTVSVAVAGPKNSLTWQWNLKAIGSGTMTTVYTIQGSADNGTNWATLQTYTATGTNSTTPTVVTTHVVTGNPYTNYRTIVAPALSGTVSCTISKRGYLLVR